jgi:hypothetical protein
MELKGINEDTLKIPLPKNGFVNEGAQGPVAPSATTVFPEIIAQQ